MNRHTFLFIFLGIFLFSCRTTTESLPHLFSDFRTAAKKGDEAALRRLTLDFTVRKPKLNLQEGIVKGVLTQREKGDFAYSDAAIQCLRKEYLSKFQPISEDEFQKIAEDYKFSENPQLQKLRASDVLRIEQGIAKVVVLHLEDGYKLFYWRDLNALVE